MGIGQGLVEQPAGGMRHSPIAVAQPGAAWPAALHGEPEIVQGAAQSQRLADGEHQHEGEAPGEGQRDEEIDVAYEQEGEEGHDEDPQVDGQQPVPGNAARQPAHLYDIGQGDHGAEGQRGQCGTAQQGRRLPPGQDQQDAERAGEPARLGQGRDQYRRDAIADQFELRLTRRGAVFRVMPGLGRGDEREIDRRDGVEDRQGLAPDEAGPGGLWRVAFKHFGSAVADVPPGASRPGSRRLRRCPAGHAG